MKQNFTIRVYGICIRNGNVLLSDEIFKDIRMTKFPGGGLKFGEGTKACLQREINEEFGLEADILEHFYTTDYFQPAKFFENTQLISIYYKMEIPGLPELPVRSEPFVANNASPQILRWMPLKDLDKNHLTFAIDQKIAGILTGNVSNQM
ncbi:NUDIX domain-containing protein [Natronoflexus pectinivorans]|nr:NUDIX domain-containing protein [Natronoflexus pectinivorans]